MRSSTARSSRTTRATCWWALVDRWRGIVYPLSSCPSRVHCLPSPQRAYACMLLQCLRALITQRPLTSSACRGRSSCSSTSWCTRPSSCARRYITVTLPLHDRYMTVTFAHLRAPAAFPTTAATPPPRTSVSRRGCGHTHPGCHPTSPRVVSFSRRLPTTPHRCACRSSDCASRPRSCNSCRSP